MKAIHEESILIELTNGNISAFDAIYRTYSRPLYLYLLDRLKDSEICEDILQDVFVSLWEKRGSLQITTSLKAYLYQSVKYKIVDEYRKNYKYEKYLSELGDLVSFQSLPSEDSIDYKSQLSAIRNTLDTFPRRMKEIFVLSRFEHLPVNAIAEKLSISPQTVKNQITKALSILRQKGAEPLVVVLAFFINMLKQLFFQS